MQQKNALTGDFEQDVKELESTLRITESFDLVKRIITPKNNQRCAFFYIAGFADGQTVQDFMRYCLKNNTYIIS
jgi:hypothetical protein